MKQDLYFDFTLDKATRTVNIAREFSAELPLVWDVFTKAELLDQWTAPAPYKARTKHMNFEVGGKRFYAMVSPDGTEMWVLQTYTAITPKTNFKLFNVFTDKDENPQPFGSDWKYDFSEKDGKTLVQISIYNESLERMERMIEMGFKEGFMATLVNLDNLLLSLK